MKPVQLIPQGAGSAIAAPVEVIAARPSSPNGAIGIIAGGLVAMAIAGYFEFAAHSNAKTNAASLTQQAADAATQTSQVQTEITAKSGTVNDWSGTAQTVATTVISTVGQRKGYPAFMADLRNVVTPDLGLWLSKVDIGGAAGVEGGAPGLVTIQGHAPTWAAVKALQVRLDATASLSDAQVEDFSSETTTKHLEYIKFTITAHLADDLATASPGASAGDGGTTVGSTTGGEAATDIAIDPEPGFGRKTKAAAKAAAKPAKPKAKPPTAMEQAIAAAGKAGGSK